MPERIERYHADVVVTMDEAGTLHAPGTIEVADGRIRRVGPATDTPPGIVEHRLGGILMPGLIDLHAHSPMILLRGAGEGLPLERWLTEAIWPREAHLRADDVAWGMRLAAAELLRNGVTTSVEMYFFPAEIAAVAAETGLRTVVAAPIIDAPVLGRGTWEEQLEAALALLAERRQDPLVEIALGPHSAYTLPEAALVAIAGAAREHDLLLHIHVAETEHEGDAVRERHGLSVPRFLADRGILDLPRFLAAHAVWLDDADLATFAEHGAGVAHCPGSNAKLASGIARLADMLIAGVPVGVGTDGPASNDDLDLWEELRWAAFLARLRAHDAAVVGAETALALATRGAARALGRGDLGVLAPGRRADFLRLDLDDPALAPVCEPADVVSHLAWSAGARQITDVWVEGRHVVADGAVTTVDVPRALHEVTTRARRLADAAGT